MGNLERGLADHTASHSTLYKQDACETGKLRIEMVMGGSLSKQTFEYTFLHL